MKTLNQVFKENFYLSDNYFPAIDLLRNETGKNELEEYYRPYLKLAEKYQLGFVIESPTWRASADWGFKLGYSHDELFALNKYSIKFVRELSGSFSSLSHVVVSGNIGPRGDGYRADFLMTPEQSKAYHLDQVKAFAMADADIITASMLNYSNEAIGIVNAARSFGLPVVISFAVETDGRLPGRETLREAIERVDDLTEYYTGHFMINCEHPQLFIKQFYEDSNWKWRIAGIRSNGSLKSHAELLTLFPSLKAIGMEHTHLEEICHHVLDIRDERVNPRLKNIRVIT